MVFSSILFIFFFLPIFLITYFLFFKKFRNYVLLLFSLIFYAWGEPIYVLLMILSAFVNYIFSILISKNKRKLYLIIAIIINILILGFFKYGNFILENINLIFNINIKKMNLSLPIGISFFTFQALSYTVDVYRGKVPVQKNYFKLLTYICMFPQLIAGPIVRYEDIMLEMDNREVNFEKFSEGMFRFLTGLYKKVLIANIIGMLWDKISTMNEISMMTAWLGALAFAIQIYFDFSGYSDMAIGLGKMIGFNYLENFNYPYIATTITDFWRRWHISLSSFFRDYVYIPLGGNKVKIWKHIRNILIVWCLTGLWHGANYNFIIWGLYYGLILIIEKYVFKERQKKWPKLLSHIYTLFIILIGWIIFAIESPSSLISYLKTMFFLGNTKFIDSNFIYLVKTYALILIFGIIFSIPFNFKKNKIFNIITIFIYIILFILTLALIVSDTYNPFIYFRF